MGELEYTKFEERLDWAIKILKEKFGKADVHDAIDIAKCLFVRSEIQYSQKR